VPYHCVPSPAPRTVAFCHLFSLGPTSSCKLSGLGLGMAPANV
jgi:hypothetical protein